MFFIFDVDGTLTPSRQRIDPYFEQWFIRWMDAIHDRGHSTLLVTGSDYSKTVEQLGNDIVSNVEYCCNCLGNYVLYKNDLIHSYEFNPSNELIDFLHKELEQSPYTERYGNHIENRGAMINFSIVGRNAVGEQRSRYYEWDKLSCERLSIAEKINFTFTEFSAQAGGETGIDIIPKGKDKSQVIKYVGDSMSYFFGDRMDDGGNDQPLAKALKDKNKDAECIHVKTWNDTFEILNELSSKVLKVTTFK